MNKKHYLIYQITNTVNNKIYIGKHIAENVDDDYFGSGKLIVKAINKYGLDKFVKTILFELQNEEEMNLLEKMVVTQEFCDREDTYNINVGGDGGWSYVNKCYDLDKRIKSRHKYLDNATEEDHKRWSYAISNGIKKRIDNMTIEQREEYRIQNSERAKKGFSQAFKGKTHSKETRKKISCTHQKNPQTGSKNGMYGKHWIRNSQTKEFKLISKDEILPIGWEYGKYQTPTEKVKSQVKMFSQSVKGKHKIFNSTTNEVRYISDDEELPIGFERRGRPMNEKDKQKLRDFYKKNNEENIAPKRIKELRPMYQYYLQHRWNAFKDHFNYQYTQQNFVALCKRYLPEYMSHQGKQIS